jgi:hypothetical protein
MIAQNNQERVTCTSISKPSPPKKSTGSTSFLPTSGTEETYQTPDFLSPDLR